MLCRAVSSLNRVACAPCHGKRAAEADGRSSWRFSAVEGPPEASRLRVKPPKRHRFRDRSRLISGWAQFIEHLGRDVFAAMLGFDLDSEDRSGAINN
jgi:hypothetical protein